MGHKTDLFSGLLGRLLLALPFLGIQAWLAISWGAFGGIAGMPFGAVAAIILWPRLGEIAAEPFRAMLYPIQRFDKPVPMYSVPMSKRARGAYAAALADYERMELEYPGDMEVYRNMLELLILEMKDPEKASEVFQRALRSLRKTEQREGLARIYQGMLSQVKGKPEWLKSQQERTLSPKKSDGVPVIEPDGLKKRRFHSGGHYRNE